MQTTFKWPRGNGLRLIITLILISGVFYGEPSNAMPRRTIGFRQLQISSQEDEKLTIGIWYPSKGTARDTPLEAFHQEVVADGPVVGKQLPLVVISHGGGGSFASHYDTALALARKRFVVAAVSHRGDTYDDQSKVLELWRRPRQLSRLVSYMLDEWPDRSRLNPRRVGAFGFSNGGFTVLVAIGGVPDLRKIGPYCEAEAKHDLCQALQSAKVDLAKLSDNVPLDAWAADTRIRAAVIAAPAFGFAFTPAGLSKVRVPIQLWRAQNDRHQPHPFYEEVVRKELPIPPEYHVVRGAGHFDFLPPYPATIAPRLGKICADPPWFDRARFHKDFNRRIVLFFESRLRGA